MIPVRMRAGRGDLFAIKTDKFKTETLTISQPFPMEQRRTRLCNLLFSTLRRGSRVYPDIASLSRALDDLYDANIATMVTPCGENISAGFALECLDCACVPGGEDILRGTLGVLREMLFSPLLDERGRFFERILSLEKKNLADNIRASDNDPKVHSYHLCRGSMFEGEPYGKRSVGSVDDVMSVTPEDLTAFHEEYLSLSAPVFVYVGRREPEEIKALIEEFFGDFGGRERILGENIIKSASPFVREVEEEMSVLQGKLTVGFRSDISPSENDIYSALVLNDIFGGSPASKLFRNVREKMSLCYSCSSSYDLAKGAIIVRAGLSNENKETVVSEITSQFDKIKQGEISDYELECSKLSLVNYYRSVADSPYSLESFYRNRFLAGIETNLKETEKSLRTLKKEDIINAASRFGMDTCAYVRGTLLGGEGCGFGEFEEE